MNVYREQEERARAYNRAFLDGKKVGVFDGAVIALDLVSEAIDHERELWETYDSTPEAILENLKNKVLQMKEGARCG